MSWSLNFAITIGLLFLVVFCNMHLCCLVYEAGCSQYEGISSGGVAVEEGQEGGNENS